MTALRQWLLAACGLMAAAAGSGADLGKGALLVASREMQSSVFSESVILLLAYDAGTGAMGVIVNRPTVVKPAELLPEFQQLSRYRGTIYLGGPVEVATLVALLQADRPPEGALNVFGHVHLVQPQKAAAKGPADSSRLRFYVGYAGWAPGQLEDEIDRGDWHVRAATADVVFAADAQDVWGKLVPPKGYRTASSWIPAIRAPGISPPPAG